MTPLKTIRDFDKEFEEKFGNIYLGDAPLREMRDYIKSFFHSKLDELKKEILEEVKNCVPEKNYSMLSNDFNDGYHNGFNSAIEQMKIKIKEKFGE